MNNEALYLAINEIDEDLIMEAGRIDFQKKSTFIFRRLLSFSAAAAVFILATCSAVYFSKTNKPLTETTTDPSTTSYQSVKPEPSDITNAPDTTHSKSPETDGLDSDLTTDFSHYTLAMWLDCPDVVWGTNALKGEAITNETAPLGTVKITDSLKSLIKNNGDISVYAVLVDFSSCVDEYESENWEHNGVSAKELQEYFKSGDKTDEGITEYKKKLREIKTAYNNMRINTFEDTFSKFGLKIYTVQNDTSAFSHCFYIFATSGQIQNLECKTDEAFVLSPAAQFKIR